MSNEKDKMIVFQEKHIRRIWHKEEWWFAVVDVIEALTESTNPAVYWRVLKKRLKDEGSEQTVTICNGLKMVAKDGKKRKTGCANAEIMFRLIQSNPFHLKKPNLSNYGLQKSLTSASKKSKTQNLLHNVLESIIGN